MPQATFWFASPFREWTGQRDLTLTWEGTLTLRDLWRRLAADYPRLRAKLPREGLDEEAMGHLVAVIVDGDILTLDSVIRDGARVDILAPLSGGALDARGVAMVTSSPSSNPAVGHRRGLRQTENRRGE